MRLTPASSGQLAALGVSKEAYAVLVIGILVVLVISTLLIGLLFILLKPQNPCAVILAFACVLLPAGNPALWEGLPELTLAAQFTQFFRIFYLVLLGVIFPNGKFVPNWSRRVVFGLSLYTFIYVFFLLPAEPGSSFSTVFTSTYLLVYLFTVIIQIYRYRKVSTHSERQQSKWVIYGMLVSVCLGTSISLLAVFGLLGGIQLVLPFSVLAGNLFVNLTFMIAVFRYRLWDIDIIINRTLVYGALTFSIVGLYVLIVGGFGLLLQAQGNWLLALAATGLIAVLFQPLRLRLQAGVNRVMYGERDNPYRVISRLGERLEASASPHEVLPGIVETLAQALKLPYAAISFKENEGATGL